MLKTNKPIWICCSNVNNLQYITDSLETHFGKRWNGSLGLSDDLTFYIGSQPITIFLVGKGDKLKSGAYHVRKSESSLIIHVGTCLGNSKETKKGDVVILEKALWKSETIGPIYRSSEKFVSIANDAKKKFVGPFNILSGTVMCVGELPKPIDFQTIQKEFQEEKVVAIDWLHSLEFWLGTEKDVLCIKGIESCENERDSKTMEAFQNAASFVAFLVDGWLSL